MGHITEKQRYTISIMLESGYSQSSIAEVIGKDKSVIRREFKKKCLSGTLPVVNTNY